jgi:hypothetical protein
MNDRKRRLLWTVLAILLPGPWTPVIVLAYVLRRAAERDWDNEHDLSAAEWPLESHCCPQHHHEWRTDMVPPQ